MKTIANILVEKRYIILSFIIITAVTSIFLMQHVNINYDMTKYLPDKSEMKIGMDIMNEQFPDTTNSSLQIMFENLTTDEKTQIYDEISSMNGVINVDYNINSNNFNKDIYTLYIVNTNSGKLQSLIDSLNEMYEKNYTIYTATDTTNNPVDTNLLGQIIPIAIAILIIILLLMSSSWFEPVLFLITIGIAVIINMGTNIFLPSVSNMTFSIAAVMQLVLSMDYSIILMNRYRQEKANLPDNDKIEGMKNAIIKSFKAILSSSATTIVGLLALVFMSFKICGDMGVVFAKGVFISLVSIFTILPSLIIWTDKILTKTLKRHNQKKQQGGVKNV